MTIEGQVDEPFGPTLDERRADPSTGVKERINYLLRLFKLADTTPDSGKLKALGVAARSPSRCYRSRACERSPRTAVKDYDLETIRFIVAPAKTPPHLVKRLNQHIVQIMQTPDVKDRLAGGGSEAMAGTPEQLMAKLKSDEARMRKLFEQIGLSPDK